jgi:tetratricopeptide (TPR) repeat protein
MKRSRHFEGWIIPVLLVPFALRAAASFVEPMRLWGLDYLRYLDPSCAVAWSLAGLFVLLLARVPDRFLTIRGGGVAVACFALLGAVLFLSPITTFFYGDGGSYVPNVFRYHETGAYDAHMMMNVRSGILTGVVQHLFVTGIPAVLPRLDNILYPWIAMSWLALLLLAVAYIAWMRREADGGAAQLLLVLGGVGTLFLLGYVEFYTLPLVMLLLFLLAAEHSLRTRGSVSMPIALYVLAVASHYMYLALAPAFVTFLALRFEWVPAGWRSTRHVLTASGITIAVWIVVYAVAGFASSDSRIVMPLFAKTTGAGTQAYTLLSSRHLVDILNILLFIAPVPLAVLVASAAGPRRATGDDATKLYLVAMVFLLAFLLFANTVFGLARDFDIFAPLGIVLALFAHHQLRLRAGGMRLALIAGVASVVYIAPWIVLNLDEEATVARFESVLRLDDEQLYGDYALSGYEALRKYHLHKGDLDGEVQVLRRQIELLDYPEHYRLLIDASLAWQERDPERYVATHAWMLDRLRTRAEKLRDAHADRDYNTSVDDIVRLTTTITSHAYLNGTVARLQDAVRGICALTGRSTPLTLIAGMDAFAAGRYTDAHAALMRVREEGFESDLLYGMLSATWLHRGDPAEAARTCRIGREKYPQSYRIPMSYAIALVERGMTAQAIEQLREALAASPPDDIRTNLESVLQQLTR